MRESKFVFCKSIPAEYGECRGFVRFKGKLLLLCANAIIELTEKKKNKKKKLAIRRSIG